MKQAEPIPDCGLCLESYRVLQRILAFLWLFTTPIKCIENSLFKGPISYVVWLSEYGARELVVSIAVGWVIGWGFFTPLATVAENQHGAVCSTYLSIVSWMLGHWLIYVLASMHLISLLKVDNVCGYKTNTYTCKSLTSLSEPGYLGMALGLLTSFGNVAFNPHLEEFEWCRLSESWPAEMVYVPVFLVSTLAAFCVLTPAEEHAAQGYSEVEMELSGMNPHRGTSNEGTPSIRPAPGSFKNHRTLFGLAQLPRSDSESEDGSLDKQTEKSWRDIRAVPSSLKRQSPRAATRTPPPPPRKKLRLPRRQSVDLLYET